MMNDYVMTYDSLTECWNKSKDVIMALGFPDKWEFQPSDNGTGACDGFHYNMGGDLTMTVCPDNNSVSIYQRQPYQCVYVSLNNFNLEKFKAEALAKLEFLVWPHFGYAN